ncbi:InlB B-repeat-containing protein [Christensenellaceae bacterium OttesenSCG-928-L17]|nr:InlB B-repeat-containing protein [Christensenellaceae bacterium OttesenSCG-928-L17]
MKRRRIISAILAFMMIFSIMPVTAMAEGTEIEGGLGMQIAVPENLGTEVYPKYPNEGYVRMTKNATWDDYGANNYATITFDIWGKPVVEGVDVILVMDRSGSMGNNSSYDTGVLRDDVEQVTLTPQSMTTSYTSINQGTNTNNTGGSGDNSWRQYRVTKTTRLIATDGADRSKTITYTQTRNLRVVRGEGGFLGSWGNYSLTITDALWALENNTNRTTTTGGKTWAWSGSANEVDIAADFSNLPTSVTNQLTGYWRGNTEVTGNSNIYKNRLEVAKGAAKSFLDVMFEYADIDNRVALVSFSSNDNNTIGGATTNSGFTANKETLVSAVNGLSSNGGTSYTAAMLRVQEIVNAKAADEANKDRKTFVVFMSDGAPGSNGNSPNDTNWNGSTQAAALKAAGVTIYAIGFGKQTGMDTALGKLATTGAGYLHTNISGTALDGVFRQIAGDIKIAGTNAVLTDKINTQQFTLRSSDDIKVYKETTPEAGDYVQITNVPADFFIVSGNTITFDIGKVVAEGAITPAHLKIEIGVEWNGKTNSENLYTTNDGTATLNYDNYLGEASKQIVKSPQVGRPDSMVQVRYILTNSAGKPITVDGDLVATVRDFEALDALPEYLNEDGKIVKLPVAMDEDTAINIDASTIHSTITVGGIDYTKAPGTTFWLFGQDNVGTMHNWNASDTDVTVQAKPQIVYLGYYRIYDLTYDGNGGTYGTPAQNTYVDNNSGAHYNLGATAAVRANAAPEFVYPGYTFEGWNTAADGNGDDYELGDEYTLTNGSNTLYAIWEQDEYTVIYAPGDGGDWDAADQTTPNLHYGDTTPAFKAGTVTAPNAKNGYTFTGWSEEITETVTKTVTYTAQWRQIDYTVIYAPGAGGNWLAADETTDGLHYGDTTPAFKAGTVTAPNAKNGYTFTGWSETIAETVTKTVTYTAQWRQIDYTVTYAPGAGGNWLAADETTEGLHYGDTTPAFKAGTVTAPNAKNGYTFISWDQEITDTVTKNVVYMATWLQNEYTVTYNPGTQGTWKEQVNSGFYYGANTPAFVGDHTIGNPGWKFAGWDKTIAEKVTETVVYTATWEQEAYTIIYLPGTQGTWAADLYVTNGLNYGDTTPAFCGNTATDHQPGYKFVKWSPDVANTVTKTVSYTATWDLDSFGYTVEYYTDSILDGNNRIASDDLAERTNEGGTAEYGTAFGTLIRAEDISLNLEKLGGAYTTGVVTNPSSTISTNSARNVIKVLFTKGAAEKAAYRVEYYYHDGTDYVIDNEQTVTDLEATVGSTVTKYDLPDPAKEGYVFSSDNVPFTIGKNAGENVIKVYFDPIPEQGDLVIRKVVDAPTGSAALGMTFAFELTLGEVVTEDEQLNTTKLKAAVTAAQEAAQKAEEEYGKAKAAFITAYGGEGENPDFATAEAAYLQEIADQLVAAGVLEPEAIIEGETAKAQVIADAKAAKLEEIAVAAGETAGAAEVAALNDEELQILTEEEIELKRLEVYKKAYEEAYDAALVLEENIALADEYAASEEVLADAKAAYDAAYDAKIAEAMDDTILVVADWNALEALKALWDDAEEAVKKAELALSRAIAGWIPVKGVTWTESVTDLGNGVYQLLLGNGKSATFSNLPAGTVYTLTEIGYWDADTGENGEVAAFTAANQPTSQTGSLSGETSANGDVLAYTNTYTVPRDDDPPPRERIPLGPPAEEIPLAPPMTGTEKNLLFASLLLMLGMAATGITAFYRRKKLTEEK